jgi:uncharacterized protein (UPF0332 family)
MLVEKGFPRQATARAYFAAFYAAREALEAAGNLSPSTRGRLPARFSELADATPAIGGELGGALGQLETGCREADDGERTISVDVANDAITRAEHIVEVVEKAIAGGLG